MDRKTAGQAAGRSDRGPSWRRKKSSCLLLSLKRIGKRFPLRAERCRRSFRQLAAHLRKAVSWRQGRLSVFGTSLWHRFPSVLISADPCRKAQFRRTHFSPLTKTHPYGCAKMWAYAPVVSLFETQSHCVPNHGKELLSSSTPTSQRSCGIRNVEARQALLPSRRRLSFGILL